MIAMSSNKSTSPSVEGEIVQIEGPMARANDSDASAHYRIAADVWKY